MPVCTLKYHLVGKEHVPGRVWRRGQKTKAKSICFKVGHIYFAHPALHLPYWRRGRGKSVARWRKTFFWATA